MLDRLLTRCGQHFILVMMLGTRVFGTVGGLLVIYYVEFTMKLPDSTAWLFRISSLVVVRRSLSSNPGWVFASNC